MALSAGTRLGPYEILAPLGAGGMGEVYRARDPRLKREVAVKVLPDHSSHPDLLRRFEEEAHAVAALNHPHILAVHDVGRHDGVPYIVFELLEGEPLRKRITHGALPARKALEYAVQLCQGLAAAHERGIVHRDLKPENLFLTKDGSLKILDFGLARLSHGLAGEEERSTTTLTKPGTVLGTVGYLSPEQAQGSSADARSDIFAVGAILYEMLSGRRAFQRDSSPETLAAIIREDPPELTSPSGPAPPALDRVVRRCLEKEPHDRFQSARDLAFALEALSGTTTGVGLPAEASGPGRRRPWWRAVMIAVALVAAAVIGLFAGRRSAVRPLPSFTKVTFSNGPVYDARFTPDGHSVVFGASWSGRPPQVYSARISNPVPRAFDFAAGTVLSVSRSGELALLLNHEDSRGWPKLGTLAVAPLAGGAPRERARDAVSADWAPDGSLCLARRVGDEYRLEWPPGQVLYRTRAGPMPVRVSPRGDRVGFIERGSLKLLDRDGRETALPLGVSSGASIYGWAWAPGGREAWFITEDWVLRAVDLSGARREIHGLGAMTYLYDISADGRVLLSFFWSLGGTWVQPPGGKEREVHPRGVILSRLSHDGSFVLADETLPVSGPLLVDLHGSPPIRIELSGIPLDLSPQGRRMLVREPGPPPRLVVVPTGAGEPQGVPLGEVVPSGGRWFDDGETLLVCGGTPGEEERVYVVGPNGTPRAVTAPGAAGNCDARPSPDGRWIAVREGTRVRLYPTAAGEPQEIPGDVGPDVLLGWSPDGRFLHLRRDPFALPAPAILYRLEVRGGRQEAWMELFPPDPLGLVWVGLGDFLQLSRDASAYAYYYGAVFQDAYVVEGLN